MNSFFLMNDLIDDIPGDTISTKGLYNVVVRPVGSLSREMVIITRRPNDYTVWDVKDTMEDQLLHQFIHCDHLSSTSGSYDAEEYAKSFYRWYLLNINESSYHNSSITQISLDDLIKYIYKSINNNALTVTLNDESVVEESKKLYLKNLKDVNAMIQVLSTFKFDPPQEEPDKTKYWNEKVEKVSTLTFTRLQLYNLVNQLTVEYEQKQKVLMNALFGKYDIE